MRKTYDHLADYQFFLEQLPVFIDEHLNQVVLINERTVVGYFDTLEDAVAAGVGKFGAGMFSAQEIVPPDPPPLFYSLLP